MNWIILGVTAFAVYLIVRRVQRPDPRRRRRDLGTGDNASYAYGDGPDRTYDSGHHGHSDPASFGGGGGDGGGGSDGGGSDGGDG